MIAAIIGVLLVFSFGLFAGLCLGALLDRSRDPEPDEHRNVTGCGEPPPGRRIVVTAWDDEFYLLEK